MEELSIGQVVAGTYRIEERLTRGARAQVYAVKHLRFPDVALVLKVVPHACAADFERDTVALGILTSAAVAHMCDRGVLADGRPFRVVMRLKGPTLAEALATTSLGDDRITEICVALATLAFEAHRNGVGPLDFSLPNLMFADGPSSALCLVRVLRADAKEQDPAGDEAALVELRKMLERGRESVLAIPWKPPSSIAEIAAALRSPPPSKPGTKIGTWRVVRTIAESLSATVYEVVDSSNIRAALKIAGPRADPGRFESDGKLLMKIAHENVVRVVERGVHDGAPFYVMDLMESPTYAARLEAHGRLPVRDALWAVCEMMRGANAITKAGGGPPDFALEHCFSGDKGNQAILTHPSFTKRTEGRYGLYANHLVDRASMDTWAVAIALYELLAGRLPFPISRQSLAKVWMGVPIPLDSRRPDVPRPLAHLVNEIISGAATPSTTELTEAFLRIREKHLHDAPPDAGSKVAPEPHPVVVPPIQRPVAIHPPPPIVQPSLVNQPPGRPPPPLDWRVEIAPMRCPLHSLIAAAFSADGTEALCIGLGDIAHFAAGVWRITMTPDLSRSGGAHRVIPWRQREFLALGKDRHLYRISDDAKFVEWPPNQPERDFHGLAPYGDKGDRAYLVGGAARNTRGIFARVHGEKITVLAEELETPPLNAAAAMQDGSVIAVGARGAVVRLRGGATIESICACANDLYVVAAAGPEVLIAGQGAYAFRVRSAPLAVDLESVDTTSNLTCLFVDEEHNAWMGTDRGRILRRRERHWRRMTTAFPGEPAVLALHATPKRLRGILADGTLIHGTPIAAPPNPHT